MGIYEELQARGLIAQVTDEEEIRELINNGKATFYIGFDPTADSLHVGHFMALCLMKRLQEAGNRPIALIGGGTGYIGDPSGRTDMRSMMTPEQIQHNCDCFKKQMSRFIDFSEGKALMVNNADWLLDLNYIEMLREIGPHFSVNRMLQVTQVFVRGVGTQCVGRDLHAAQVFAGLRSALRRCEAESCAAVRAEPQFRIDGQPQGVGHAFAEEHAEDRRPSLDHQPLDAPLLQLGDDQLCRNWFFS